MPTTTELTEGLALQTYVQLATNAKGKQAAAVILQAVAASNVYVFGELLNVPSIQQLESTDDKKQVELLKIFAYGTFSDFKQGSGWPQITPGAIRKLKQLTIVSIAATNKVIPYNVLHQQLDIQDVRELEDLIIDAMYQGVFQGRLDQRKKHLEIEHTMGRDLKPASLDSLITTLTKWHAQSEELLGALKAKMAHADTLLAEERKHKEEFEKKVESEKKRLKEMELEMGEAADLMQVEDIDHGRRGKGGKSSATGKGKRGMN